MPFARNLTQHNKAIVHFDYHNVHFITVNIFANKIGLLIKPFKRINAQFLNLN